MSRLTSRPVQGRLVIRQLHRRPHTWKAIATHEAVVFRDQVLTQCGLVYPDRPHPRRVFAQDRELVPVTCQNCLANLA